MNVCKCIALTVLTFSILGVNGCRSTPGEPLEDCAGASSYVFALRGEDSTKHFTACTSDPDLIHSIQEQLDLPVESRMHIHGDIAAGNAGNFAWSWHFVKDAWTLADMSIELCDGDPMYVEQHLDAWLAEVGVYCPWGSYVIGESVTANVCSAGRNAVASHTTNVQNDLVSESFKYHLYKPSSRSETGRNSKQFPPFILLLILQRIEAM